MAIRNVLTRSIPLAFLLASFVPRCEAQVIIAAELDLVPDTAIVGSGNNIIEAHADGLNDFRSLAVSDFDTVTTFSPLHYNWVNGNARAQSTQSSTSGRIHVRHANHSSGLLILANTINDARVFTSSSTGASADYKVRRMTVISPSTQLVYQGQLSVSDSIDDNCFGPRIIHQELSERRNHRVISSV